MITVTGVRFRNTGKVYYFDPGKHTDLKAGTGVIVETARGLEFGTVSMPPTEVKEMDVVKPLMAKYRDMKFPTFTIER